jgi:hypothetical protein
MRFSFEEQQSSIQSFKKPPIIACTVTEKAPNREPLVSQNPHPQNQNSIRPLIQQALGEIRFLFCQTRLKNAFFTQKTPKLV